jgi:hypothetical protein
VDAGLGLIQVNVARGGQPLAAKRKCRLATTVDRLLFSLKRTGAAALTNNTDLRSSTRDAAI